MTLQKGEFPILDFDTSDDAVIHPLKVLKPHPDMPERVVMCFFNDVLHKLFCEQKPLYYLGSEIGKNPVYVTEYEGTPIAIMHPGVGAPLAGAFMEELYGKGGRKFIAVGGAGVLDSSIDVGYVIIPTEAVRDDGTSYHYLPAGESAIAHPDAIKAIETTLTAHKIPYDKGKTWTTDAIYRETRERVAYRQSQGCITVEMETATFMAIAQFRNLIFGQILYGGDDVAAEQWDSRDWHKLENTREKLFWLAVESASRV